MSTTSIVTDILWGSTPMITPFVLLIYSPHLCSGIHSDGEVGSATTSWADPS